MYLLRRQIVFQTYGRWSGWNMKWTLMICIYLDDKLSSKLMEDDQDEMIYLYDKLSSKLMEDDLIAYMYLLIRQIIFQTYGRWSGWNGWYLSRLWYVFT